MWVFMNNAFLSIVQDKTDPDLLAVRARVRGDIPRVFGPNVKEIVSSPDADYAFRAFIPRDWVARVIGEAVLLDINYHNFKDSVKENDRHDAYLQCWRAMNNLQRLRKLPAAKRRAARKAIHHQDLWGNR